MDSLDDMVNLQSTPENTQKSSNKNKKRKWREIEALKDKQKLYKELQELDLYIDEQHSDLEELDGIFSYH